MSPAIDMSQQQSLDSKVPLWFFSHSRESRDHVYFKSSKSHSTLSPGHLKDYSGLLFFGKTLCYDENSYPGM